MTSTLDAIAVSSDIAVEDPITGQRLYSFTPASPEDCRAAMAAARAAAQTLREAPIESRLQALDALIAYLQKNQETLLDQVVAESGRSRGDAMLSDMFQLTEDCRWLRENAASILADEKIPTPLTLFGKGCRILYQPRGVVLVISPWNLPLAIGLTAAMFAFVAGNAVILKPSEHTPMVEAFRQICALHPLLAAGLRVVHGKGDVAAALIAERPDLICFTGSATTGKKVLAQAAPMVIPAIMELGSKDAMIVFPDADMSRAVAAACWGNLHNSGQSCTAVERVLVHQDVFETFTQRLVSESKRIRLGTGPDADMGAITTDFQIRHIEHLVRDARNQGARVLCGGERSPGGRYFLPTVITHTTSNMRIEHEEIFGPVLTVSPFATEAEAVALHNATPTGLSTSVWTHDEQRAERLARALETGCVNVNNVMLTEGNPGLPFGGVKYSGYGRMKGVEGLRGMTRSKAVMLDSTRGKPEPNWYPYSAQKLALTQQLLAAVTGRSVLRYLDVAKVGLRIERLVRSLGGREP